jgi:hypothetical protein
VEGVKGERTKRRCVKGRRVGLTRQILQVPFQGLILGLASVKFGQQLLEDVGPKLVDTLKEQQNDLSKS